MLYNIYLFIIYLFIILYIIFLNYKIFVSDKKGVALPRILRFILSTLR